MTKKIQVINYKVKIMGSPAIKKLLGQRLNEDTDSEGNKHSPETDFQGI